MLQRSWLRNGLVALLAVALLTFGAAMPARAASFQNGDQICTGNTLTVAEGQSIGNILALGCNVEIQHGATVSGSIADFGGNVTVAGTVNGSIAAFGGNVFLSETAVIGGQVAAMGGNYTSTPGAVVRGNANTTAPTPQTAPSFNPLTRTANFGFDILGGIVTALAFAALGALIVIFAPTATRRVSDAALNKPLNTGGIGCLTLIVLPILGILLAITIIGIPIAFLLGFVTWAAWVFGGVAIGLLAGEKILGAFKVQNILPVLAVMLGIVLLMLVGQVPILGWLVSCLVGFIGLGAVVMTRFGTRTYPPTPTMALAPIAPAPAAQAPAVPGTYTPSAMDVAAWEAKARETQMRDATPPAENTTPAPDAPPAIEPPATNGETKTDA